MSNIDHNEIKFVADLIRDEYKTWHDESVILDCGTGIGKTYFILHYLSRYALDRDLDILYLCNRNKLKEQIQYDVTRLALSNIDVKSYQQIQDKIEKQEQIKKYDYIVADECHYFISDATFNRYTDLSYDFIMSQKDCVIIYMSATAKSLYKILRNTGKVSENRYYYFPPDYSYVEKIYFFEKNEQLGIINDLLKNTEDKIIYFCNSKKRFKELYNDFEESDIANFLCSEFTEDARMNEINQPDCIIRKDDLITFEKRLLITTKALDNGVDLKDPQIKHIITDIFDLDSAVQCLGRKRSINWNDTCNFYIKNYNKKTLVLFHNNIEKELKPVMLFKNNYAEFLTKYASREFKNDTIYTDWKGDKLPHINNVRLTKLLLDSELIKSMYKIPYFLMILNYLGSGAADKVSDLSYEESQRKSKLERFLESNEGKKLYSEDQKRLIDICNIRDDHNRQLKGLNTINSYLEECNLIFTITSKRDTTGKKRYYWIIENGLKCG